MRLDYPSMDMKRQFLYTYVCVCGLFAYPPCACVCVLCACSFSLYSCINLPRKFRVCCKLKMGPSSGWGSKVAVWHCDWDWDLPSPSPSSSPTTHANNISMLLFQIPMGAGTLPPLVPIPLPLGTHLPLDRQQRLTWFPLWLRRRSLVRWGFAAPPTSTPKPASKPKPPERAAAHASICRGSRKP